MASSMALLMPSWAEADMYMLCWWYSWGISVAGMIPLKVILFCNCRCFVSCLSFGSNAPLPAIVSDIPGICLRNMATVCISRSMRLVLDSLPTVSSFSDDEGLVWFVCEVFNCAGVVVLLYILLAGWNFWVSTPLGITCMSILGRKFHALILRPLLQAIILSERFHIRLNSGPNSL